MGKCKFKSDWLLKKDSNGDLISSWASKLNEVEAFCKMCSSSVDFSNKGFHAFVQHSETAKHKKFARNASTQMTIVASSGASSSIQSLEPQSNSSPAQIKLYSSRNAATISELIWVMKSVCCNYSASSCHNIKDTFGAMFPEAIPKEFTLSPKKMNYLITDALQPYFHQMLLEDVGSSFFTICFDETTNVEDKKELLISIRYWSENKGEVVQRHLQTYFIGKADANVLFEKINCALERSNLSMRKLLMIGSDGPNVNKSVHSLINESLIELRSVGLFNIGTCPIHIVHNAYLKALQTFGEDAADVVVCIYHYFDGWPSRWEDYEKIQENLQLPHKKFLKHSPSRWLTFHGAAERLLEQWKGVVYYFQKFIPTKKDQLMQSNSFKRISNLIRDPTIKAKIYFAMSSAELFTSFTETFQKDEPLIHALYLKLEELVGTLARRVCKTVTGKKHHELFEADNILPLREIVVPQQVKEELESLSEKSTLLFMRDAKDHYIAGCNHLITKALKNCSLLKSLQFLCPSQIKNTSSCKDVLDIARQLPISIKQDKLMDELKLLQLNVETPVDNERIDHYWQKILNTESILGEKKYVELGKIVKACLSLSHGNANIERRFSVSRRALTEDKASTSERTFNAIMTVKDALKTFSNKPELVPMTSKLITMGQNAHKQYVMYQEEQKKLKEIAEKMKEEKIRLAAEEKEKLEKAETNRTKINQIEEKIVKSKKEHKLASEASNRLFKEANDRLKKALQKGDMSEISVAQGMLEGILRMRETEQQKLKEVEGLQKNAEKRKNSIITSFFSKKAKLTSPGLLL